jgi:hypothetical protein
MDALLRCGAADVPYLNCRECGLSIRSQNPLTDRAYCPRCRARGHIEPLFRTPLPLRHWQQSTKLHNADTSPHPTNHRAHVACQQADIERSIL